jgi:ATP-dependent Clp protease ATP-binding subunit ClpX
MSKNDFDEFQKQIQKLFGKNAQMTSPFNFESKAEEESIEEEPEDEVDVFEKVRNFNLKPREIRDELDRYVIKQDEAKKVLSVAVCDHYNHVRRVIEEEDTLGEEYAKQNILVLGPTGVGKTYLLKCIARIIGVPFIKADATKFSETGYVGRDVEDMVRDLVKAADDNAELAEYGIIYIDEVDKIAAAGEKGQSVNGKGVQINLLKLMEDADVNLKSQMDMMGQMESMMGMMDKKGGKKPRGTINTRHILFIVSGAFSSLAESIERRITGSKIGFMSDSQEETDTADYLKHVETSDLVKYGFEPEFIGRLPVRVACESLHSEDLKKVLTNSKGSILRQYEEDFAGYGITFNMEEPALDAICAKAYEEKTGARGLMTVLEKLFRNFKFDMPSTEITEFDINEQTVADPKKALKELLNLNKDLHRKTLAVEVAVFVGHFKNEHDFKLEFDESAISTVIDLSVESGKTIRTICEEKFKDYPYGLKLIAENTKCRNFKINKEVILFPDKELSRWVVERFQKAPQEPSPEKEL